MSRDPGLFGSAPPPRRDGIDLRCVDADRMLDDLKRVGLLADMVYADPPWSYDQRVGTASVADKYRTISDSSIALTLGNSALVAKRGARLVEWQTWPKLAEAAEPRGRWKYVTGGAWLKSGHYGPGFHWAGCSEFVKVYRLPGKVYCDRAVRLENAWTSPITDHSEKPVEWLTQMVRRWVPAGGTVVEIYAGLGGMARAVLRAGEGRRYIGCEIDADRHAAALSRIAQDSSWK